MIKIANKNGLIDPTVYPDSVSFLKKVKSKEFRIKQSRKRWKIRRGISK